MCLIVIAVQRHRRYPLIVAANRDEFHQRQALAAHLWEDFPDLLAGRDLKAGGTWLGVDRRGRIAAVTNLRVLPPVVAPESRGHLVSRFLQSDLPGAEYLRAVQAMRERYAPFNLLAGDGTGVHVLGGAGPVTLAGGVHAISNAEFGIEWPKTARAVRETERILAAADDDDARIAEALFGLLADRVQPDDGALPETGVGIELERRLATIFVAAGEYGTRCSTVVLMHRDGSLRFEERSFDAAGNAAGTALHRLDPAG
jgi:uncharacterized protein with NRDE domain